MKIFFPLLMASSVISMLGGLAFIEINGPVCVDPGEILSMRHIVAMLLVLPFMETVMFQWAVFEFVFRMGRFLPGRVHQRAIMAVGAVLSFMAFAGAHFAMNGHFNGFAYGVEGGVILAIMYALNRDRGRQQAFFSTWMLHAASNGLLLLSLKFHSEILG